MRHIKNEQSLIALSIAFVVICGLCMPMPSLAQMPQPPDVVVLSDPIRLSADPVNITADGISTSTITADVVWPEGYDILTGTPACYVEVSFYTTLGKITESNITLPTPDNQSCIAIAILTAGTEPGTATITAMADIAPPDVTALVRNTTTVTFLAPGETPTPGDGNGGNGNGGNGGTPSTPPAGTSPYLNLAANPVDIPADGITTSTLTASAWDGEEWVLENLTVNFSASSGDITASAVIENGTATAILTAGMEEGIANVTAETNLPEVGIITNTTTVNFTAPGATPTPPILTPTPTVTVSPTATPSPGPTSKPLIPGFEAVFAIAGLLVIAYLALQRRKI